MIPRLEVCNMPHQSICVFVQIETLQQSGNFRGPEPPHQYGNEGKILDNFNMNLCLAMPLVTSVAANCTTCCIFIHSREQHTTSPTCVNALVIVTHFCRELLCMVHVVWQTIVHWKYEVVEKNKYLIHKFIVHLCTVHRFVKTIMATNSVQRLLK